MEESMAACRHTCYWRSWRVLHCDLKVAERDYLPKGPELEHWEPSKPACTVTDFNKATLPNSRTSQGSSTFKPPWGFIAGSHDLILTWFCQWVSRMWHFSSSFEKETWIICLHHEHEQASDAVECKITRWQRQFCPWWRKVMVFKTLDIRFWEEGISFCFRIKCSVDIS